MIICHGCRDSQGFPAAPTTPQRTTWAAVDCAQGCRKNDTFRPPAWRGDECARQVQIGLSTGTRLGKLPNAEPFPDRVRKERADDETRGV